MSDNDIRKIRSNKVLDSKRKPPAWQSLGIEVPTGGVSLMVDEFGMPKIPPKPLDKQIPELIQLDNNPVNIKATNIENKRVQFIKKGSMKNTENNPNIADDKFIPPKDNFVIVGGSEDHTWYDKRVTGIADDQQMVDNNEVIDVEKLQGINPLIEKAASDVVDEFIQDEFIQEPVIEKELKVKEILQRLDRSFRAIVSKLKEVNDIEELHNIRKNIFSENGIFYTIVEAGNKYLDYLDKDKRQFFIAKIKDVFEATKLEFEAKELEFLSSTDSNEEAEDPNEDEVSYDQEEISDENTSNNLYILYVDNKLYTSKASSDAIKDVLKNLLLKNEIDISRIMLLKKINIDFGIILEE
jgi:hypothetical protein